MTDAPSDVWNEIRFTSEGISISLFSEWTDTGAILEDETWFTYDELQEMSPSGPLNLSLTEQSRSTLAGQETTTVNDSQESEYTLPEVGQMVQDTNPSGWNESNYALLEVVEISDKSAGEYFVDQKAHMPDEYRETVANANPSCDPDEPVIEAEYVDGTGESYGFPVSRLEW